MAVHLQLVHLYPQGLSSRSWELGLLGCTGRILVSCKVVCALLKRAQPDFWRCLMACSYRVPSSGYALRVSMSRQLSLS